MHYSNIIIKTKTEIEGIRRAGRIIKKLFKEIKKLLKPGITTYEINQFIEDMIISHNAEPVFKGYRGFPASSCISVNEEVIHGIPNKRKLKEGDIVKIDVGVKKDGYIADAAATFGIGDRIDEKVKLLVETTKKALYLAIDKAILGNRIGDISHAIESTARDNGFNVIREYGGHGVGLNLHEGPHIPNFGKTNQGIRLIRGMTLAIEPMLTLGTGKTKVASNKWTVVTQDGKPSAHFEHTIAITNEKAENLTN